MHGTSHNPGKHKWPNQHLGSPRIAIAQNHTKRTKRTTIRANGNGAIRSNSRGNSCVFQFLKRSSRTPKGRIMCAFKRLLSIRRLLFAQTSRITGPKTGDRRKERDWEKQGRLLRGFLPHTQVGKRRHNKCLKDPTDERKEREGRRPGHVYKKPNATYATNLDPTSRRAGQVSLGKIAHRALTWPNR